MPLYEQFGVAVIVSAQPTEVFEPCICTLNNPAARHGDKRWRAEVGVNSFNDNRVCGKITP